MSFERSSYPTVALLQVIDFSTNFPSNRINPHRKCDYPKSVARLRQFCSMNLRVMRGIEAIRTRIRALPEPLRRLARSGTAERPRTPSSLQGFPKEKPSLGRALTTWRWAQSRSLARTLLSMNFPLQEIYREK